MRRPLLKISFFLIILLITIVTLLIVLHKQTNVISDSLRVLLNRTLADVAKIEYTSLKGDLFNNLHVRDLRLTFENGIQIQTNRIDIGYSAFATISSEYHFNSVFIDSLKITLPSDSPQTLEDPTASNIEEFLFAMTKSAWYHSFLASLPDIKIADLEIRHGRLEIKSVPMTIDNIYVMLSGYINPEALNVEVQKVSGQWLEKDLILNDFGCRIDGNDQRITLNQIRVVLPESRLYSSIDATMTQPGQYIISIEDAKLNQNDLAGLIDIPGLDSSDIFLDSHVHGVPDSFFVRANLKGFINQYPINKLSVNGEYIKGAIRLTQAQLQSAENSFRFNGELSDIRNYLFVRFNSVNVQDFLAESPRTRLNGSLFTNLSELTIKPLNGRGNLELVNSAIDSVKIDSLRFGLVAVNNNLRIIEPSFLKFADQARFSVTGTLDQDYQADFRLSTEYLDMLALSQALNIDSLAGIVDANLFITGSAWDPNITGYIWVPYFENEQIHLDSLILQIKVDRILSSRRGDAFFSMTSSRFGPLEFKEARADIIFDSNLVSIDTVFMANGPNFIAARGHIITTGDTIELDLSHFRIFYENYWIDNLGNIIVHFDPSELLVEQAIFVAPGDGRLEIRGYWEPETNDLQTGLLMRNMNITPLEQFVGGDINFSGVMEGDLALYDALNEIELEIELKATDLYYNRVPFGSVNSIFTYTDNKLYFEELSLALDSSRINLDGDVVLQLGAEEKGESLGFIEQTQADVKLEWENIDLANYAPLFNLPRSLSGVTDGRINIAGTVSDPTGIITMSGRNFSYDKFFIQETSAHLRFDRNFIYADTILADVNGTLFQINGRQQIDLNLAALDTSLLTMPLELNIYCEDDSIEFIGFLTDQIERIYGPFTFDLTIGGTPSNPGLKSGRIELNDGVIELSRVKNPIRNVNLEADISDGVLNLTQFYAFSEPEKSFFDRVFGILDPFFALIGIKTASQGEMDLEGLIDLNDLAHPIINLTVIMNEFYLDYFVENTELILSTDNLTVTGRDTLLVTGDVELSGKYVPDLNTLQKNIYLSRQKVKSSGRQLGYDLNIFMPGNFVITSSTFDLANNFRFDILGELRVSQKPGSNLIEILGPLEINSGSYGSWGQDFDIESGQIVFRDPKTINPDLDIRAERTNRGMVFELSIKGNLEQQQLDLQVRDENNQYLNYTMSDKITLLTLGATTDELSGSDFATAGTDVINTSVETAFSRGAESITGLDKVSIDMEGGLVDLQSMKLNNGLQDASLSLGKYIYSNLYLEYTSKMGGGTIPTPKLSWEPGNQIGLKYRINRNWSVNSDYSKTQRGNNLIQISLAWKTTF